MRRRSFIRILFTLPILLSLFAWAWSTTHESYRSYYFHHKGMGLDISNGFLEVMIGGIDFEGWTSFNHQHDFELYHEPITISGYHSICNFGYALQSQNHIFVIPLWFFLIASALAFAIIWRITRPKLNPKSSFPIELASKETPP